MPAKPKPACTPFASLTWIAALLLCSAADAQEAPSVDQQFQELLERASELAESQQLALKPLPDGQTVPLRAVVMEANGRCQWRPDRTSPFQAAKVDDELQSGAEIRTALGASMALRVGHNASLLIGQESRLVIPEAVQDGATLRTTIQLTRGRADFKVDRVGLANDFSIVTPSTTLAVRGSAVRVQYGGLLGTETFASPSNELGAIEVRYFLTKLTALMSGAAITTDQVPDPVLASLFKSFGPPGLVSAFLQSLIEQAATLSPDQLLTQMLDLNYEEFITTIDPDQVFACPPELEGMAAGDGSAASPCTICINLFTIVNVWAGGLVQNELLDPTDPATIEAFERTKDRLTELCPPDPFTFGEFFQEVRNFCHNYTSNPVLCERLFSEAAGIQ